MAENRWENEARAFLGFPRTAVDATPSLLAAFAREVEARVWEEAVRVSESQSQLSIVRERLRQRAARARGE